MNITKEKWTISGGTNYSEDLFIYKAGEHCGGRIIATVHGDKAIASLIVAAPELLAACERDAMLADHAILRTPTSPLRNKLTEVNLLRLKAISNAKGSK